jgi:hypothetical protein
MMATARPTSIASAIFTDYYGQQSCTAGRAAFITGQSPMRTGLLKVGLPGANVPNPCSKLPTARVEKMSTRCLSNCSGCPAGPTLESVCERTDVLVAK